MSDPFADESALASMSPEQKERHERGQLKAAFSPYGELFFPGDAIAPILTPHVRGALTAWMIEMNSATALKKVGLTPRSRAMLSGPPGCGKTTLAHHVAARIGLPLLVEQTGSADRAPQTGEAGSDHQDSLGHARVLSRRIPTGRRHSMATVQETVENGGE